jgi:hypothetical protein
VASSSSPPLSDLSAACLMRVPGTQRLARSLRPGGVAQSFFCSDCGRPFCPACECCTEPVWAMPMTFQCACGWSGVVLAESLPDDIAASLREVWDAIADVKNAPDVSI